MDLSLYFFSLLSFIACIGSVLSQCKYPTHTQPHAAQQQLKPLEGKSYSVKDNTGKYSYVIGICIEPEDANRKFRDGEGVVQTGLDAEGKPTAQTPIVVGKFTETSIMSGTNWILLEYHKGDPYLNPCAGESRKATIMITCNPTETEGKIHIIEENTNKTRECYYLFELEHQAACPVELQIHGLSVGSVIVIIFFCVVALYLLGGFLYQRFVVGAKGLEQIPNFSFWKDFGNLQADGCNLICRSGRRHEPRTYKGVGDDQLQDDDEDLTDDHLLPM